MVSSNGSPGAKSQANTSCLDAVKSEDAERGFNF